MYIVYTYYVNVCAAINDNEPKRNSRIAPITFFL